MKYLVLVKTPMIVEVDTYSPDSAIQIVKRQLIDSNQIKENDPIEIQVIEEGKIIEDESTYSY